MRNHSHTLVDSQEEWRNIWKSLLWIQKLYHQLFVWCESGTVVFSKDAAHLNFRELTEKSLHIFLLANYISNCIWIYFLVCRFCWMPSQDIVWARDEKVSYEVRTQDPTKQHFIIKGNKAKKGGDACRSWSVKAKRGGGCIPSNLSMISQHLFAYNRVP